MKAALLGMFLAATLPAAAGPTIEVRDVAAEQAPHVHVLLRALDDAGAPIAGLTTMDFEVFDDGQRVDTFEVRQSHPDSEPVALSILIDVSGSMTEADVDNAVAGTQSLLGQLPPEDPFEIVAFNSEVVVVNAFDQPLDPGVLAALTPRTDTKLNDAIVGAIDRIAEVPAAERALVVLTDGTDDGSVAPTDQLLARVASADTTIHAIGLGDVDSTVLEALSTSTGGSFQHASDGSELVGLYSSIASSLLTEYRLSFASTLEPGPHDLTVVATTGGQSSSANIPYVLGPSRLVAGEAGEIPSTADEGLGSVVLAVVVIVVLIALLVAVVLLRRGKQEPVGSPPGARSVPLPVGTPLESYHLVGDGGAFPIAGRLLLGRDPLADVVVGEETVSRSHAQLEQCDGGVRIQDLGSANGTRINGALIETDVARPGDRIAFGDLDFELRAPTA